MDEEPNLVEAAVPPPPTIRTCPGDYTKYKSTCFKFGSHSSYDMAKSSCELVGARLANVGQTFSKYIRNQVMTMGGNDFWIGSFVDRGKTYKQKGRTSCPIMRGQMINNNLYGLVDCNSANRFICQKFGPAETTKPPYELDSNMAKDGADANPKDKMVTTESPKQDEDGGLSPVIYVVITALILILVLIALKLLLRKYFKEKKKKKSTQKPYGEASKDKAPKSTGNVFFPKRKQIDSKRTSIDSAVPPSNPSPSISNERDKKSAKEHENNELERMARPRVNGPVPTRKPPHEIGEFLCSYHGKSLDRNMYDRNLENKKHRRTYSDPRSDYSHHNYNHRSRSRRKHSYYSEYSSSESDSDDSNYSGQRYGPTKVYQRHPSRSGMEREPQHYHIESRYLYGPPQRDYRDHRDKGHRSRSKSHHRPSHVSGHYNNSHDRYMSHAESQYGHYGKRDHHTYDTRRRSRVPTVSARVPEPSFERQYFPQPHRLMSWTTPAELKDGPQSIEPLVQDKTISFQKEPIRVSRQIHQPQKKHGHKRSKKIKSKDENHFYETLDEARRNKQLKKAAKRNRAKKKSEDRHFVRSSQSRLSARSVASIQSRRLPTPPT